MLDQELREEMREDTAREAKEEAFHEHEMSTNLEYFLQHSGFLEVLKAKRALITEAISYGWDYSDILDELESY